MERADIAFRHYNPFTDTRIDPKHADQLFAYPELPDAIHDAARTAKKLLADVTHEQLIQYGSQLPAWISEGEVCVFKELNTTPERNYLPSDDADCLLTFFNHGEHAIPVEDCPRYMAVLALALIGELANHLWQDTILTEEIINSSNIIEQLTVNTNTVPLHRYVDELKDGAIRAANCAERLNAELPIQLQRQTNTLNAAQSHKFTQGIQKQCIAWLDSLPKNHGFSSSSEAVDHFLRVVLDVIDQNNLSSSYPEYLKKNINKYYKSHPPHPINIKKA